MYNITEITNFVISNFPEAEDVSIGWRVRCPNPEHPDVNPSCTIFKNTGGFNCFSCGCKGNFSKLKSLVGIDNETDKNKKKEKDIKNILGFFEKDSKHVKKKLELSPIDREWRNFTPEFLTKHNCMFWYNTEYFKPVKKNQSIILTGVSSDVENIKKKELVKTNVTRIYMPFILRGIKIGWTGRKLKNIIIKDGNTFNPVKYRIGPKGFKSLHAIYEYDSLPYGADRIFICEGPVSALRLINYGLNAVSAISATSWSEYKLQLILAKQPRFVYVCGDGDDAGQEFNDKVFFSIKPYLKVKRLKLPNGEDPDSVDKSFFKEWIKDGKN